MIQPHGFYFTPYGQPLTQPMVPPRQLSGEVLGFYRNLVDILIKMDTKGVDIPNVSNPAQFFTELAYVGMQYGELSVRDTQGRSQEARLAALEARLEALTALVEETMNTVPPAVETTE